MTILEVVLICQVSRRQANRPDTKAMDHALLTYEFLTITNEAYLFSLVFNEVCSAGDYQITGNTKELLYFGCFPIISTSQAYIFNIILKNPPWLYSPLFYFK